MNQKPTLPPTPTSTPDCPLSPSPEDTGDGNLHEDLDTFDRILSGPPGKAGWNKPNGCPSCGCPDCELSDEACDEEEALQRELEEFALLGGRCRGSR